MGTSAIEKRPPSKSHLLPDVTIKDCGEPWDRIDVMNSGEIMPCCFAQETLGNIIHLGAAGVFEGPRRLALQQDVAAGRLNPLCFNAACTFSRHTMMSPWKIFFPADRFVPHLGQPQGPEIDYRPNRGDGMIFGGPNRNLPAAGMEAQFIFSGLFHLGSSRIAKDLATGHVFLEVMDGAGHVHARAGVPTYEIESAPPLKFRIEGYYRERFEFRAFAQGVNFGLIFKGVRLTGTPVSSTHSTTPGS